MWKSAALALSLSFLPSCLSSCNPSPDPKDERQVTVYLSLESNTSEEKLVNQDILYELSKSLSGRPKIVVDELKGHSAVNIFSDTSSSHVLKDMVDLVEVYPSDDEALIASIHRAVLLGKDNTPVCALFVTSGTVDKQSIEKIRETTKNINANTQLIFLGVTEENRLPMSDAFREIKGNVKIGSSDSEMMSVTSKIKG